MYKEGILNLIPILYFIVPIILGLAIGFICYKFFERKTLYSLIISVVISLIYMIGISLFNKSSKDEILLFIIMFIWNSILICISSIIYLYFNKK